MTGTGTIESFLIKKDTLVLIDTKPSGGAHPCHVSLTKDWIYF